MYISNKKKDKDPLAHGVNYDISHIKHWVFLLKALWFLTSKSRVQLIWVTNPVSTTVWR